MSAAEAYELLKCRASGSLGILFFLVTFLIAAHPKE